MTFSLGIQNADGHQQINISPGETIFVVGANGTGKSSLVQRFATGAGPNSRRISAGRQTWLDSSTLAFTASQKSQYEQSVRQWDNNFESRFREQNAALRSGLTLYDLIDAENVDAREIARAMRAGNLNEARSLADRHAPIAKLNELLNLSNMPINLSVESGDKLVAVKNGGPAYGAAELSDGERNALLIAADVLTSRPNTLLLIDEPERHLHRSIISPLLSQLFRYRSDCAFIIATHDLMLPVDCPEARVLLVRSCVYSGPMVQSWDYDLLPANADVDEELKQDIVGARRKIVFTEGDDSSLDHPLYSVLFPNVSVRPKGSSRNVEHAVRGITASEAVHWVKAWGIIDNDGRDQVAVSTLQAEGLFALPFYSVESIYYHPKLIAGVADRVAAVVSGGDGDAISKIAIAAAVDAVKPHLDRLASRAVEKSIRHTFFSYLPTMQTIEARQPIELYVDTAAVVSAELVALQAAANSNDWTRLLTRCPIRETPALDCIARHLGLRDRHQYESAVLQMLRESNDFLALARSFFGALPAELGI